MEILLTGSVAYDYLMCFPGFFKDHILIDHLETISLSFLVESMTRVRGGIAPNIAYTMASLGNRPRLWATVGEDFEEYRLWLESKGVDTSGARVIPGEYTASFFVNTDRANAQIASFYPGAMAYAAQLSLSELADNLPDMVVISPNDPAAMILYVDESKQLGVPYIYDPSQQIVRLSAQDLRNGIIGARALFVNEYEFCLIENATGMGIQEILHSESARDDAFIVITKGSLGAEIWTRDQNIVIPVVRTDSAIDPTGVGDAFRGGFLSGLIHGLDLETCGHMGALAATYCLEKQGSQGHSYKINEFIGRFRQYYDDQGKLDSLLDGIQPGHVP